MVVSHLPEKTLHVCPSSAVRLMPKTASDFWQAALRQLKTITSGLVPGYQATSGPKC